MNWMLMPLQQSYWIFYESTKIDGLVKSLLFLHPREGGDPERVAIAGPHIGSELCGPGIFSSLIQKK